MNQKNIDSRNNKRHEYKISSFFYNKSIHEKSKDNIKNLPKYIPNQKLDILFGESNLQKGIITNSILKSIGCQTTAVSSGFVLMQELKENFEKYNVVITDNVYLTGETGKDIIEFIKKNKKEIKTIVLTDEKKQANYFINLLGFDGYLSKPLSQKKAMDMLKILISDLEFIKARKMYFISNKR